MKVSGRCTNCILFSLDFRDTEAVVRRCSSEQVLVKFCNVLVFLFDKVACLQACNFIKKRLQHRRFSVKFAKSFRASFLQNTSGGCFWKYLMNSLFIAYENDKCVIAWCVLALQRLFHFNACVWCLSISSFCSHFCVDFTTCLSIEVSLSLFKTKQWSCS